MATSDTGTPTTAATIGGIGPEDGQQRGDRLSIFVGATAGALLVALLAVPRLGTAPLWLDEAYSLGVVHQFGSGVRYSGGTMLGYYALLWVWTRFGESPAWLRLFSTVLAMVAMVPLAAVGRKIGGRRLAVLGPVLLAGAYMFQTAALEARAYMLEIILVTSCWYLLIRAVETGIDRPEAKRFWVGLAILAPLGVMVHGLFVLFVAAMLVAAVLSPRPRRCLTAMVPMMVTTAVATAVLAAMGLTQVGNWIQPMRYAYVKSTLNHYLGGLFFIKVVSAAAFIGLSGWVIVDRLRFRTASRAGPDGSSARASLDRWLTALVLVWVVVPPVLLLLVSTVNPRFQDRYIVAIAPAVALMVGLGTIRAVDWTAQRLRWNQRVASAGVVFIGAALVVGWVSVGQTDLDNRPMAEWDEVVSTIAEQARPGDGLLLYGDMSRPPFEAAWARIPHQAEPEVLNMPRRLGQVKRFDEVVDQDAAVQRRIADHERVWTVTLDKLDMPSVFYELTGPLPEQFHVQQDWTFDVRTGPATVRLYVRDDVAD